MKTLIKTLAAFLFATANCLLPTFSFAQSPSWLWAKSVGGGSSDEGISTATDVTGNIYVAGWFESSTITFGATTLTNAGGRDMFLVKYDANGTVLWAKSAGGSMDDWAVSVKTDASGNSYVSGGFKSSSITVGATTLTNAGTTNMFLVKYDTNGTELWAKSAGGSGRDEPYGGTADASGNSYMAGVFWSSSITFGSTALTNTGGGYPDMFLAKYDANGTVLWAKGAGGTGWDGALSVTTDAAGNSYVAGEYVSSSITFGPTTLTNTNASSADMVLVKYDANGTELWAKSAGGTNYDIPYAVTVDASGNSYVAGGFQSASFTFGTTTLTNAGSNDMFIVKYDATGTALWAKSAGGSGIDYATSLTTDASGNIYLAGSFASFSITFGSTTLTNASGGGFDMLIMKYDATGTALWAYSAGGTAGGTHDIANSVTADVFGDIYVTGWFNTSSITFGSTTLTNAAVAGFSPDMYIAKLSSVTSIADLISDNDIVVYPNPTTGNVAVSSGSSLDKIEIYNVLGEKVYEVPTLKRAAIVSLYPLGEVQNIDLSSQPDGIYFINIRNANESFTQKLIIQK